MGTISKRKSKNGDIRYRASIRINREGYPPYSESKTFSRQALAATWLKKRESEIELNPDILLGRESKSMRLCDAIERYLTETSGQFGRSHVMSLKALNNFPLSKKYLHHLKREDYTAFANARLNGLYAGYKPIKPQTLNADLIGIRAVLRQARLSWGIEVNLSEFEDAMLGLKHGRKIASSAKRSRTPTSEELQHLTEFFYTKFQRRKSAYPMHLIMWLAIYMPRRQDELTRLRLDDLHGDWWLVRDSKSPKGSQGHHINTRITPQARQMIDAIMADDIRHCIYASSKHWDANLLLPISAKNISASFTRACKVLGIDDLHFHDLRHEGATRLAEQGLSIPEIQQVTGHESWSSLQRYVNIKPRPTVLEFSEAIKKARD